MFRVPVARRRYDITPAEMLDLARTAVDAVVAELRSRTEELLPDQLGRLEQVSASLAKTVTEVAESSYRSQMESVRAGLDGVRDDISGAMAEHNARLVQTVENRLAAYDPAELSRRLPPAVASAVLDGLENALPTIDKGLHEVRELVGELVERGKRSELSRQSSLDRLDEVLIELRAGLTENVTRQHAVLLEVLDEKLSGLRLSELASELPGRIGLVISDAVQKSHDVQAGSMQDLASGLGRSLDAGLSRQRSATAELSANAELMAASVSGFSEVAQEAVTVAFERAQAAQAQRLNTMMRDLREAQEEVAADLKSALDGAVHEMRSFQEEQAGALAGSLEQRLGDQLDRAIAPQVQAAGQLREGFEDAVRQIGDQLVDVMAPQVQASEQLREGFHQAVRQIGDQFVHALAPQVEASEELRESFAEAVERLGAQLESALAPQLEASLELRNAFDVVTRELLVAQQEDAAALTGELERRLGARFEGLVLPHQESMAAATRRLAEVVAGQSEAVAARLDTVAEELSLVQSTTEAQRTSQESVVSAATANLERLTAEIELQSSTQDEALRSNAATVAKSLEVNAAALAEAIETRSSDLTEALERRSSDLSEALERRSSDLTEALRSQSSAQAEALRSQTSTHAEALSTTRDQLTAHLSELMETVSPRVSAELAAVLEESRTRQERVEGLIAELAWIVGEQRAGAAGIRDDLARALEALPDAIASIQEASLRSEARITDLLSRKLQGPDAR